jgi:hypothetical protein
MSPIRDNTLAFEQDLKAYSRAVNRQLRDVVRMVIFELLRMIVVNTPVDKGRAAGSWMVARGATDGFVLPDSAQMTKEQAIHAAMDRITHLDFSDLSTVYWIYNNLPYIVDLEYGLYPNPPKKGSYVKGQGYVIKTVDGYSRQAPAGMVRISMASLGAKMDFIVRSARSA